jgi:nitroreductase/SAM-dependent methyltransferase
MKLEKAIKGRRSIRRFKKKGVQRKKILEIIDAARWAPSACNRQLWEFVVVTSEVIKEELVKKAGSMSFIKRAPVVIVVLYDNKFNLKQHANYQSAAAAIQNILLKAYELGLGSVWLAGIGNQNTIRKVLDIPDNFDVVAFVALGYPSEKPMPPSRRPIKEIIHFEKFGKKSKYPPTPFKKDWTIQQVREFQRYAIRAIGPEPEVLLPPLRKEFEREIKIVRELIDLKEKILFLLPNSGSYLLNLIGNNSIDVYEMSKEVANFMLQRERRMGLKGKINVLIGNGEKIPCGSSKYDNVVCLHSFEYLPNLKIIKEVYRILKKDGKFIVSFRNLWSFYGINEFVKRRIKKSTEISNLGPKEPLDPLKLKSSLKRAGFRVMVEFGICPFPRPRKVQGMVVKGFLSNFCGIKIFLCEK